MRLPPKKNLITIIVAGICLFFVFPVSRWIQHEIQSRRDWTQFCERILPGQDLTVDAILGPEPAEHQNFANHPFVKRVQKNELATNKLNRYIFSLPALNSQKTETVFAGEFVFKRLDGSEASLQQIENYLNEHKTFYDELHSALKRPKARFPAELYTSYRLNDSVSEAFCYDFAPMLVLKVAYLARTGKTQDIYGPLRDLLEITKMDEKERDSFACINSCVAVMHHSSALWCALNHNHGEDLDFEAIKTPKRTLSSAQCIADSYRIATATIFREFQQSANLFSSKEFLKKGFNIDVFFAPRAYGLDLCTGIGIGHEIIIADAMQSLDFIDEAAGVTSTPPARLAITNIPKHARVPVDSYLALISEYATKFPVLYANRHFQIECGKAAIRAEKIKQQAGTYPEKLSNLPEGLNYRLNPDGTQFTLEVKLGKLIRSRLDGFRSVIWKSFQARKTATTHTG